MFRKSLSITALSVAMVLAACSSGGSGGSGGGLYGGCLSVWLVLVPSSGAQGSNGFSTIVRSDGTGKQWSYKNHPLYRYTGDSGADQANGEGIPFAGGHWHVARPN